MAEAMRQLATPDTESVRWWWIEGRAAGVSREAAGAQFDRWLATVRSPEPDDAGREEPDDVWGGGGAMKCPECGRFLARPWSENSGYPDYDVSWGGICKVHGEVSE